MTAWLLLLAWVHWFSAYGTFENDPFVIVTAIPFLVFLALGLMRRYALTRQREGFKGRNHG